MSHTFLYCKKLFLAFYCLIATVAAVDSWAYWPSVRSRWPDIGQVLFCVFTDRHEVEVNENAKKYEANIQPSGAWSIKDLLYSQKENFFLRDQRGKWAHLQSARSGGQSERKIRFTLPARGFSHDILMLVTIKDGFKLFFSVSTLNINNLKSCWCYHRTDWHARSSRFQQIFSNA